MNKFRFTINMLAIAAFTLAVASMAQAQATRTWVSGVGDDVNPCSRTAPCKTFAGAISKTATGGEIDVLDPGGFGAVTITKSITIDGTYGAGFGSILHSATQGVLINDTGASPPTGTVTLKRLYINGAGTTLGTSGIRILSEKHVNVYDCEIFNDSNRGISDERTHGGGPTLTVLNTRIHNVAGDGIHVGNPTTNVSATFDGVQISKAAIGIFMSGGSTSAIRNSTITFVTTGVQIDGSTSNSAVISCTLNMNGTGLSNTNSAHTELTDSTITHNGVGVNVPSGVVLGYGNNTIAKNTSANAVSSTVAQQ
jgi:hypothetical protein